MFLDECQLSELGYKYHRVAFLLELSLEVSGERVQDITNHASIQIAFEVYDVMCKYAHRKKTFICIRHNTKQIWSHPVAIEVSITMFKETYNYN